MCLANTSQNNAAVATLVSDVPNKNMTRDKDRHQIKIEGIII